jgi:hypothetical protein
VPSSKIDDQIEDEESVFAHNEKDVSAHLKEEMVGDYNTKATYGISYYTLTMLLIFGKAAASWMLQRAHKNRQ